MMQYQCLWHLYIINAHYVSELKGSDRSMKMPVAFLVLLVLSICVKIDGEESDGPCNSMPTLEPRPHSVSILEFGAVGDGKTLNTLAFQNAIFYLKSFTDKGGAQLYVPPGRWLTGSFNLTSHLTLFLEKGATILGSQDPSHWGVDAPLPSYGRGIDVPGKRHRSLVNGYMLRDVVITGDDGIIDGQGSIWWEWFMSSSLNYSRPHLVEFIDCASVVISNITFENAPAYSIHPVYCSTVLIQNVSVSSPDSPRTSGIVPDSSTNVCIEDSNIEMGYDAIALKSGWDEYGIAYGRPSSRIQLRGLRLSSHSGASVAFGSEMSGGISMVTGERLLLHNSNTGVAIRTGRGRGGYIEGIAVSSVEMENVVVALAAIGDCEMHPDSDFDPDALPLVSGITFRNISGTNISVAGNFTAMKVAPFTSLCMLNVSLATSESLSSAWSCSNVSGYTDSVSPPPCQDLDAPSSNSSSCFYPWNTSKTDILYPQPVVEAIRLDEEAQHFLQ